MSLTDLCHEYGISPPTASDLSLNGLVDNIKVRRSASFGFEESMRTAP
ncbi:hypothetical protein AciPR4_1621 [Terriglobus saanensis SP1PR4]|uniref:Uncharacterized protein n=1 Tax=Terriglobus saanensis (strain ATCC BAA-1853 / DSM 23119 / SP1PR4) TaxID=401053 RepID=E8V378_TERSS|nr:hypothetical protein AciPR4_1621 [Terriglobus saanensis SP1PR4]